MGIISGAIGFLVFFLIAIISLFSGADLPISFHHGKEVQIFPVAKIINYNSSGMWQNEVNYLSLGHGKPDHGQIVTKITKLSKFKVTRVRLSHSELNLYLEAVCYFTNIENPEEYFVADCKDIKVINQATEYFIEKQNYFANNPTVLIVAPNWFSTKAKKVFEVNRAAVFEFTSFEELLESLAGPYSSYTGVLKNAIQIIPYTNSFKESDFYKYDFSSSHFDKIDSDKKKDFKNNIIPKNILKWVDETYRNDLNARWFLKMIYILNKTEYVPKDYEYCFVQALYIRNASALISKFNDETNARIKISHLQNSSCNFKKPTILDPRFTIETH